MAGIDMMQAQSCVAPPSGLIGWWPGDGTTEDLIAENHGIPWNGVLAVPGMDGKAFGFDGIDDAVQVPFAGALDVGAGEGFTIEAWISPTDIQQQRPIVEWNSGNQYGVHLYVSTIPPNGTGPGCLYANIIDTNHGDHVLSSGPDLVLANQFQHVALTYQKGSGLAVLYMNGSGVSQRNLGSFTPQTGYDLFFGYRPGGMSGPFHFAGALDEVSLYNRALSADEIVNVYLAGSAGKCKSSGNVAAPTITSQPQSQTVSPGGTASFSVVAQGAPPLTYQWRHNGNVIAGAEASTYTISNIQSADAGTYTVTVSNPFGTAVSQPATLTINSGAQPPVITSQPQSKTANPGGTVEFTVTVEGVGPFSYQWLHAGVLIPGATGATLTLTNVQASDGGIYIVVVSNGSGSVVSQSATLSVTGAANSAPTISPIPDQFISPDTTTPPLAFTVNDVDSPIDSLVVTASSSNTAVIPNANIVLSGTGANRTVVISPAPGQTGLAEISLSVSDGSGAANTTFRVTVSSTPARVIRVVNATGARGADVIVSVEMTAQGNENALGFSLQYDPSLLGAPRARTQVAGAQLNANTSQASNGRLGLAFALAAGQTLPAGVSHVAEVTFTISSSASVSSIPVGFSDQPISREVVDTSAVSLPAAYQGGSVALTTGYEADVSPRPAGSNTGSVTIADWVQVGRFAAGLDQAANGSEFQRADCAPRFSGGNLLLGNGSITISDWVQAGRYAAGLDPVTPAGGPTGSESTAAAARRSAVAQMAVSPRQVSVIGPALKPGESGSVAIQVQSPGDINAAGLSVAFDPAAVQFVGVSVGQALSAATLNANTNRAAEGYLGVALAMPAGQTIPAGVQSLVQVNFKALVAGPRTIDVTLGDQPIARELVGTAAEELSATYASGSISIQEAVNVNTPPTISELPDRTVAGEGPALVSFTVGDAETSPDALQVSVSSSNQALLPDSGILLGGGGATRSLALVLQAGQTGSTRVTITVRDGDGLSSSASFTLATRVDPVVAWRSQYFTSAELANPAISGDDADPDQDGASNRDEFLAGTNPRDSQSVLKAAIRPAPLVIWASVPQTTYRVLRSTSLTSASWVPLSPLVTATADSTWFVDTEAIGHAFYRVEVVRP